MRFNKLNSALFLAGMALPSLVQATNGMNMEGYGPIALGMGGASMAYDNGTAAMMNNPATLGMMREAGRFDLAMGVLAPNVDTSMGGTSAHSSADFFIGPAFGWVARHDKLTYGVGMYGQGGMGTEYAGTSFLSMGTGLQNRSELGVGRLIFPLTYDVSPDLIVGGSIDYVWAGLDLQMVMPNATGMGPGAYLDFSNDNDFSGKAHGTGFAAKLGVTYRVSPQLTLGGTYHSQTSLSDLEADSVNFSAINPATGGIMASSSGSIRVIDFQWPETFGLGLAYQASPQWMIVADYKRINWAKVMKNFQLSYTTSTPGMSWDMAMPQSWENQNVYELGASYKASDALILRGGVNLANNPIPDSTVNPLFPAIIKNHYTVGFGYGFNKASTVDFAFSHAPEVTVTSAQGATISHSQNNWQFIYSYRY